MFPSQPRMPERRGLERLRRSSPSACRGQGFRGATSDSGCSWAAELGRWRERPARAPAAERWPRDYAVHVAGVGEGSFGGKRGRVIVGGAEQHTPMSSQSRGALSLRRAAAHSANPEYIYGILQVLPVRSYVHRL